MSILKWIIDNMEWLFSGIGVTLLVAIMGFFIKKKNNTPSQKIKSGKNSTNVQGGGDVKVVFGGHNEHE